MAGMQQGNWGDMAQDDLELRRMGAFENTEQSGIRVPKKRKILLVLIDILTLISLILCVVATIYPVPTFNASGGLIKVTASYPNSTDAVNLADPLRRTTFEEEAARLQIRGHEDDTTEQEYWDTGCGCMQTIIKTRVKTVYSTETIRRSSTSGPTATSDQPNQPEVTAPSGGTTNSSAGSGDTGIAVEQGSFAALFLGVSGGCLQRRSGVLVCTSSSFSPDYSPIYEQAGLAGNVTAQLPNGTGGAGIGLLVAIVTFVFTFLAFSFALLPRAYIVGPSNYVTQKLDLRHQWSMAIATSLSAIGMLATVGSVISLRNSFGSSAEAVKAWDITKTLDSSLLSAFSLLYAAAILSGLVVVIGLALLAVDFKSPWWFDQLKAKEEPWMQGGIAAPRFDEAGRNYVAATTVAGNSTMGGSRYTGMGTPALSSYR